MRNGPAGVAPGSPDHVEALYRLLDVWVDRDTAGARLAELARKERSENGGDVGRDEETRGGKEDRPHYWRKGDGFVRPTSSGL